MDNKSIKVCILGAAFNTPNMGVSVLAAGALRCVLHSFPRAHIIQCDYGREGYEFQFPFEDKSVQIRFVNIRFSKKVYLPNNIGALILAALFSKLVPFRKFRYWLLSRNTYLQEILDCDLVLSLAGGDSFSDIYGWRRLLYTSLPQILALLIGRRLILLPQTIGPFRHRASKAIARYILNKAELVYSRDRLSENATRQLMGLSEDNDKLRFCYDLGFDVDPMRPPNTIVGLEDERVSDSVVIGFNVSGLLMIGGYNQSNMFGLKVAYDKLVFRLIEFLIAERSATVLLIPHVSGSTSESDSTACETVFESLRNKYAGKIGVVRGECNYAETKYLIGQCDFFIGARMHACIGALSQTLPAVSIAYSDKFIGVMETIGCQDLVVDPRIMDEEQIVRVVDQTLARRMDVRRALEVKIPLVKQAIHGVLRGLDDPFERRVPVAAGPDTELVR